MARFGERLTDESGSLIPDLADALRDWAKQDSLAAAAWLDRQIAAGKFSTTALAGENDARQEYEAALLDGMLAAAPDAATERLVAMPGDQRLRVLERIPFQELPAKDRKSYATLVRDSTLADERAGTFAHIAAQLVDEVDFAEASDFLDAVQATPAERAAAASKTAASHLETLDIRGEITRKNMDVLRTWLRRQAPDEIDRITGKTLAETAQQSADFDFTKASKMALDYRNASGREDVMTAFLQSYAARPDGEPAVRLADSISDGKLRAEILKRLK